MTTLTRLLSLLLSTVCSLSGPPTAPTGRSLVIEDDAGVVVLSWDGEFATASRASGVVATYEASSWAAAMWELQVPAYGTVSRPTEVERPLGLGAAALLESCGWQPGESLQRCGL